MLSIIIINYNTYKLTCDCIESIYKYPPKIPFEIIIVDNGSNERNPDDFVKIYSDIILVKSVENLGFAGGNNLGVRHSSGDIILLLNSDTIIVEDCFTSCINKLQSDYTVGVVSAKLLNPDGTYQKNARRFKNIKNELFDFARPIIKLLPYHLYSQYFLNQYFNGDYDTKCDWLCGAFFMFRRYDMYRLYEGKLDERFFMYGEDALWCWQFNCMNLTSYFISSVNLIHIGGASTTKKKLNIRLVINDRDLDLYNIVYPYKKLNSIIFEMLMKLKKKFHLNTTL